MAEWSQTWNYFDGTWHEGNPPLVGPRSHALWLGSCVFDGARAFEGVSPDLDQHCARVNRSAEALGLKPQHRAEEIVEIARDGIAKFDKGTALYIKPMYWAEAGGYVSVPPDPASTQFCLCIHDAPMPDAHGFSVGLSHFRRPSIEVAPVNAKAACLYPNSGRALLEVRDKGFDNAVMCDPIGNVAELATANLMMAKGGDIHTPYPNGTFLNGITRQRVIALMRGAGYTVHERTITYTELTEADELFSTGNYGKVQPITRIDDRDLQPGPIYHRARELYWDFAHSG